MLPRVLRTARIDEWTADPAKLVASLDQLGSEFLHAVSVGQGHQYAPLAGQSVGLIHDVRPAAAIVRDVADQAATILADLGRMAALETLPRRHSS